MIDYTYNKCPNFHYIVFAILECRNTNASFFKKIKCREIILLDSTTRVNMNAEEKEKCFFAFF